MQGQTFELGNSKKRTQVIPILHISMHTLIFPSREQDQQPTRQQRQESEPEQWQQQQHQIAQKPYLWR
jgi:hypothetical protein